MMKTLLKEPSGSFPFDIALPGLAELTCPFDTILPLRLT
jgi:hypothetical protein